MRPLEQSLWLRGMQIGINDSYWLFEPSSLHTRQWLQIIEAESFFRMDSEGNPLEASLAKNLKHPNVCQVLDYTLRRQKVRLPSHRWEEIVEAFRAVRIHHEFQRSGKSSSHLPCIQASEP